MPTPTWRLIVHEPGAFEREVDLDGSEMLVGRHPSSDLCLQDPSVSGRHARFWVEGGTLRIQDLGSRNATQLAGGAELRLGMSADLSGGEVVLLGGTRLEVMGALPASGGDSPVGGALGSTIRLSGRESALGKLLDVRSPVGSTAHFRPSEHVSEDLERAQAEVQRRRARLTLCGCGVHAVVDIHRVPFVVGRKAAEGIDYVLDHEQISGRHMSIEFMAGRFQVRDLGSSNGTRVAGLSVVGDFPAPLEQDAELALGPVDGLFHVHIDDAGRSHDPGDFERAAQALLDGGVITLDELERSRRILQETYANRHLGEVLLSQPGTHLRIEGWLKALAAVRDPEWTGKAPGKGGWRSLFGAASGWWSRARGLE